MCEWLPGLYDACTCAGVQTQHMAGHDLSFVPFREANYDTIELGHMYSFVFIADDRTVSRYCKEYGYCALVSARAHLLCAVDVNVTSTGWQADGQILVEVSTRDRRDSPKG